MSYSFVKGLSLNPTLPLRRRVPKATTSPPPCECDIGYELVPDPGLHTYYRQLYAIWGWVCQRVNFKKPFCSGLPQLPPSPWSGRLAQPLKYGSHKIAGCRCEKGYHLRPADELSPDRELFWNQRSAAQKQALLVDGKVCVRDFYKKPKCRVVPRRSKRSVR